MEDLVTGTAHCYLAPYWGQKLGKTTMTGFQASERSGTVECELSNDDRVLMRAKAVVMHELVPNWIKQ
jgi:predicted PhzF superfamily epimerase YddE/YHI9